LILLFNIFFLGFNNSLFNEFDEINQKIKKHLLHCIKP
jgi:NADPH-dependent 7-cyano-7-deazaguanine reductase QueF-like protein